ncbi:MAG: 30S ribosomal protein S18 [Pseudomonadota bacterium]
MSSSNPRNPRGARGPARKKKCPFKSGKISATRINYTDLNMLRKFVTETGKIVPSRITGVSRLYQSKISQAVKYARFLALIPYCDHHR